MTVGPTPDVYAVLRADTWALAQASAQAGPFALRILRPYDAERSGAMPSADDSAEMNQFESRLCNALEIDAHALLSAVLAIDGAKQ